MKPQERRKRSGTLYRKSNKLREQGMQWSVIAAALAAQGIVQGKNRIPLTTNRLTALVRQIELQNDKRDANRSKKGAVTAPETIAIQNRRLSLSSDLQADTRAADNRPSQSEDEIRRLAFDRVQRMTEKD